MEGLVIAFICKGKHATVDHYHTFGAKFWDDCNDQYKKGYYFIYYFQMETVRIHRILDVLPSHQIPEVMNDWYTNRPILCLSQPIKEFTWEEWTQDLGIGAPYSNQHHSTYTKSWTLDELELRCPHFDFQRFKTILDLDEDSLDEDMDLVDQVYQRVVRNTTYNIVELREKYQLLEDNKIKEITETIDALKQEMEDTMKEKEEIHKGSRDSEIIKRETEIKMNQFFQEYL